MVKGGSFTIASLISYQKKTALDPEDQPLLAASDSLSLQEALAQLMGYLRLTQKQHIDHFLPAESMDQDQHLVMDFETRKHLELVTSTSTSGKGCSLWEFMDHCQSAMGSRLLKRWIEMPLLDVSLIQKRQKAIQTLIDDFLTREELKEHLTYVYDMERLASRMAYGNASPRDVLQLKATLEHASPILELASKLDSF